MLARVSVCPCQLLFCPGSFERLTTLPGEGGRVLQVPAEECEGVLTGFPDGQFKDPDTVIDAGGHHVEVVTALEPQESGQPGHDAEELVTESDGGHGGLAGEGPAQGAHGVRVVEHRGRRTQRLHALGDVHDDGDVAERPADAPGPDRVAHRLADPVLERDADVVLHGV